MEQCQKGPSAKIERLLRGVAGLFLILSTVLYFYHSPNWIWFILFIGVNLFQSSLTNWCLMMNILKFMTKEGKNEVKT